MARDPPRAPLPYTPDERFQGAGGRRQPAQAMAKAGSGPVCGLVSLLLKTARSLRLQSAAPPRQRAAANGRDLPGGSPDANGLAQRRSVEELQMTEKAQDGDMVFIADGAEGIGAVRRVMKDALVIYVENAGEFKVANAAIVDIHSQKVMLNPRKLEPALLKAVGHVHDREDPDLVG
jgi:hypothetical protein